MLKPHEKTDHDVFKRASRKHDDDEHGGAWKVAFADFCLALLALFLVLWLMATRDQQSMKEALLEMKGNRLNEGMSMMPVSIGGPRGSLIERFPVPRTGDAEAMATPPKAKVRYETLNDLNTLSRALVSMSADAGLSSNLEAVVTPYGLRVMLHDTERQGMFILGSATPTDRFNRLLRKMGPLFAQMENQMLIVGHTDSLKYANTDYTAYSNWTLSVSRAMAARTQLLAGSMNPESVLQVVGMADRAPLVPDNPAAARNRRIELLILTRDQAENIAAMFGMAGNKEALTKDVDTVLPEMSAIRQLREQLLAAKARTAPAADRIAD